MIIIQNSIDVMLVGQTIITVDAKLRKNGEK